MQFSQKSGNEILRFTVGNSSLTMGIADCSSVTGSVYGDTITYPGIYPDTDLRYHAEANRLKEDIILNSYTGRNVFNFNFSMIGVIHATMPDGSINFLTPGSSKPLFTMGKPFAIDKNGNRCDKVNLELSEGQLKLTVDPEWLKKAAYPVIIDPTVGVVTASFTRTSAAYKLDGTQVPAETPRYETGKFGQAVMVEEGTTNLLFPNQSSVEYGLTGFSPYNWTTLSYDTTVKWTGNASLKIVTPGAVTNEGFFTNPGVSVRAGVTYTASVYMRGSGQVRLYLRDDNRGDGGWLNDITLTNEWKRYSATYTMNAGATTASIYVFTGSAQSITFSIDGLQIEEKAYSTSWQFDGVIRENESLTVPSTIFNKNNWSVEFTFIPFDRQDSVWNTLWGLNIDSNNFYEIQVNPQGFLGCEVHSGGVSYIITDNIALQPGTQYSIALSGNGSVLKLCKNGVQVGTDLSYIEPVGTLSSNMYIGSNRAGGEKANGLIDDLRISNRARTVAEHQTAYNSNQPLPVDNDTTCKLNFDGTLSSGSQGGVVYSPEDYSGTKPYWNYTNADLGGGWGISTNTFNLNTMLSKALFFIPGRGIPIRDGLTYNSLDTRSASPGPGWRLGSDTTVAEQPDGKVIYTVGDGSTYTFNPNGSGGYNAPSGIYLTLKKEAGNFTITDKNFNVYTYQNGKITRAVDRDNNTTTYTYDGNGRLYQQTDASGRALNYNYNASGLLDSVTNPAGHAYHFGYQNGRLSTVTDPANNVVTLGYDANGKLNSFTDHLNRTTTFAFDSGGRLLSYRDARTLGQDIYETRFTQTSGSEVVTTITDPGNITSTYYHNPATGNLTKFQDMLGNAWTYTWTNNNLMSTTDAKQTISYGYDARGNLTSESTYSFPGHNIVKTMTYDDYNQLLEIVDGGGRKSSYKYSNRGNLLSTSNPDTRESNGRKYDQYGNVIEYSPSVSAGRNLLANGSFEIPGTGGNLLANWAGMGEYPVTATLEGFNSHGNSALKLSCPHNLSGTNMFHQWGVGVFPGDMITLRADVKVDDLRGNGAKVMLSFGEYYEYWTITGTGTTPVIITATVPDGINWATVSIGFDNSCGTAWFDGLQMEYSPNPGDGYALSSFNSIENSSFENDLNNWTYTGYPFWVATGNAWEGTKSAQVNLWPATLHQDVPVYGGEPLTLSGMVKTDNVTGNGAYYKVEYLDSGMQLISGTTVETGRITGTQEFTRLTCLATAPASARYARVKAVMDGPGLAYFDSVKLVPRNNQKYTYNTAGNYILTSEDSLGKRTNRTYNENIGTELSFKDALNNTTWYNYDNLNRLIDVTDPLSRLAYYEYDTVSNLTATRDPRSSGRTDNNYRTQFIPDRINNLGTLTDPLSRNTINTYDRSGRLTRVQLPNGKEVNYTYDNGHRVTRKTLDGGRYFDYQYDGANNLTRVTDNNNTSWVWNYDMANRINWTTDPHNYTLEYIWDDSHNISAVKNTSYGNISYCYGSDNRHTFIQLPYNMYIADSPRIYYHYDENGRLFQVRYPGNSKYKNITYYPNGWVNKILDKDIYGGEITYSYYDNGNIATIVSGWGTENFNYDANGRLTSWGSESYQYDAAGNLLTKGGSSFTYNSANQINNSGFSYDNNGNLTSDGTYNYAYDAENQLTEVRRASDNGLVASYTYYYNGLRKSKTLAGGSTINFQYDAFGNLIRESYDNGNTKGLYYYDSNGRLLVFKSPHDSIYYYVHTNLRGDVVSVDDYNSQPGACMYIYDPWGKPLYVSEIVISQPFRYAGYYYDQETGLYYCKSRYYIPTLGRFLTKDSIDFIDIKYPETLNPYAYANNNPVLYADPTGTAPVLLVAAPVAKAAADTLALAIGAWYIANGFDIQIDNNIYNSSKSANDLKPDPTAEGEHSTYKRNSETGEIESYETWKPQTNPRNPNPWESTKRYDGEGGSHYNKKTGKNIGTPHVHDPLAPGGIRPPSPWEIPMIKMLKQY